MKKSMVKTISMLAISAVSINAFADTECTAVSGSVKIAPAATCTIMTEAPGFAYIGAAGTCFSVSLTMGKQTIAGVAGLTNESLIHPSEPGQTVRGTPAILNEPGLANAPNEFRVMETRRLFTARSALFLPKGTVYTADAGVIAGPSSAEQLQITGGTGKYTNASGTLYATGDLLSGGGVYYGKICTLD